VKFKQQFRFFLCIAGMTIFGLAIVLGAGPDIAITEEIVNSSSGSPLRVRYFWPPTGTLSASQLRPALIAVPSYTIPPDIFEILCVEAASRGVVCAVPDFIGRTRAESRQRMGRDSLTVMTQDVLSIVNALKTRPEIDPERIGVGGHSIGGTVAFLAGLEDPGIIAVIPIGMETEVDPQRPHNLLLLAGLYDEIRTPSALLKRLQEYGVAFDPVPEALYGDFADGTARQVSFSPTCDHFTEPVDPLIIRQILRWLAGAFAMPELAQGTFWYWWREVAIFLFILASTATYILLMKAGFVTSRPVRFLILSKTSQVLINSQTWILLRLQYVPLAFLLGIIWFAGHTFAEFRPMAADLMASLPLAHLIVSIRVRRLINPSKTPSDQPLYTAGRIIIVVVIALFLSWFVTSLPVYVRFPRLIGWYPVFVLNMIILFPFQLWGRLVAGLFADTLTGLTPDLWYWILVGSVVVVADWPVRLLNRLAREFLASAKLRPKLRDWSLSPLTGALLLVIWGIFAFLVYRRIAEGMLTLETALSALGLIFRLVALQMLIAWLLLRTRFFRLSVCDGKTKDQ
jgi:dienelactone hydrolase